uniref:Uncharacterized protein n=1 Tax=Lepeophtheirus salmonis TaxID=72036 RepID=A0A0K2TUX7_LEPSM
MTSGSAEEKSSSKNVNMFISPSWFGGGGSGDAIKSTSPKFNQSITFGSQTGLEVRNESLKL